MICPEGTIDVISLTTDTFATFHLSFWLFLYSQAVTRWFQMVAITSKQLTTRHPT